MGGRPWGERAGGRRAFRGLPCLGPLGRSLALGARWAMDWQLASSALPAEWGTARVRVGGQPSPQQQPTAAHSGPPAAHQQPTCKKMLPAMRPMRSRKSSSHPDAIAAIPLTSCPSRPSAALPQRPSSTKRSCRLQPARAHHLARFLALGLRLHTRSPSSPLTAGRPFHSRSPSTTATPLPPPASVFRASTLQLSAHIHHTGTAIVSEHTIYPPALTHLIRHSQRHPPTILPPARAWPGRLYI